MRSGITSLDMNMLLDDTGVKEKEKKKLPPIKKNEEKDFVLFEEKDLEENRRDSEKNPAEEENWFKGFGDFFAKPDSQTTRNQAGRFGGEIVSNAVDFLDSASKEAGFSLLGISAGNYLQIAGECFDEYRKLREMGYSREEAFGIATEKAMIAILSLKADDYFEKSNLIDDVLYGKEGIIRKVDSDKIKDYNGTKLGKQEYARLGGLHKFMKGVDTKMLTENEKRLLDAIMDSGLPDHLVLCLPEGMDDDQMQEMTDFIREKMKSNQKLTENDVVKKRLIILGVIEDDE